jgi:hypothetical protein
MRKIRGQDLYKVFNSATGEITSKGSSKEDAKAQLRLLRGLEKKEGGALKADQIKEVLDLSYTNKKDKAPDGYVLDKGLSDGRVKVYKDLNSDQVIVAHRGSSGWKDWLDNAYYATTGNIKDSGTYKTHKKKHEKALDKYGADNVISVGHSRAGKYVEELNKEKPVKEVLTYNKAVGIHDAFQTNPENQTDIRSSRDLVSGLSSFQKSKNKVVTIPSKSFNLLKAHGTSALSSLGNKLIGKGIKRGGRFEPKGLRVGDMRKFIKAFKKAKHGEKWTGGSKYTKKELADMLKPMLEDDDIDEMIGGSVWTDFVKEFSAKHSLKYGCALSKYIEPLRKAYKLFKEKKDWYEPFKIDAITEVSVEPEKANIVMSITEPKAEPVPEPSATPKKVLPPIISEKEIELLQMKKADLLDILTKAGIEMKWLKMMNKDDLVSMILKMAKIPAGVRWEDKRWLYEDLKNAHRCLDDENLTGYKATRYRIKSMEGKLDIEQAKRGAERKPQEIKYLKGRIDDLKNDISKCDELMKRDFEKEYSGSGVLSGGNRWTDFVKDYAKSYNTTYGCALSDFGIKGAYKLFKDGKTWYFPKVIASVEVQTEPEFIEPAPEPAPANIEPTISRIEEKVRELERVGAEHGAVSYNASVLITDIAFVNLLKKYGGKCIVNNVMQSWGVDLGINLNSIKDQSEIFNTTNNMIDKLGGILRDCVKRGVKLICIPLSLSFAKGSAGHANMLVYRPFKRIVERFEPHGQILGSSMVDNSSFNSQLRDLFEVKLKPYLGDVRFVDPADICPNPMGFQALEGSLERLASEGGGFCSMWSFFLAEMTFINPDKSTKEIIDEVFEITAKDPTYLKSVIRGYVIEIEAGLDELLKTMGSNGFSFKGTGLNAPYLKIAGKAGQFSAWILQTAFDSGKYSEAPPQYEPLPDVPLKDKSDEDKLKDTFRNKLKHLTKEQLNNIYGVYGLPNVIATKDDIIHRLIIGLSYGKFSKQGATGLDDLDVILEQKLYEKGDRVPKDYFIQKRRKYKLDDIDEMGGGYFKIGSRSFGKKHG